MKAAKTKANETRLRKVTTRSPIDPNGVVLVQGKGSPERGGGPGGTYWHIHADGKRVGHIFINIIHDDIFGDHPSIQIHINQASRGKQIGRIAYRMASETSGHSIIYAHMRKNNIASKRAAEEAGFKVVEDNRITQLAMVWNRG